MVTTSEVEYEADGGVVMVGHLAVPDDDAGAALPAVLVAHEAPGLDDVHRERADRLAERGYVAFALDAHGGGRFRLGDPRIRERVAAISNDPDRARSIADRRARGPAAATPGSTRPGWPPSATASAAPW